MSYTIKNTFYDNVEKVSLCGLNDEYLKLIENGKYYLGTIYYLHIFIFLFCMLVLKEVNYDIKYVL